LTKQASEAWTKLADELSEPAPFVKPKQPKGRAFSKLLAATHIADDDFKVAPENRVKAVNDLHREIAGYFLYDLGLRFQAFVKANPDLESGALNCLHSLIGGVESQCQIMREALYPFAEGYVEIAEPEVTGEGTVEQPPVEVVEQPADTQTESPVVEQPDYAKRMAAAEVEEVGEELAAGNKLSHRVATPAPAKRGKRGKHGALITYTAAERARFAAERGLIAA
jgi:hypothetical protein